MKNYLGIDPGASGAIAVIGQNVCRVWDYPGEICEAAALLRAINLEYPITLIALEKVSAMPRQGVVSMFKFGMNFGGWIGAIGVLGLPVLLVTPRKWQIECLDSGTGETKARSLSMARRLYPDIDLHLKKHDGRADALHLARYAKKMDGEG